MDDYISRQAAMKEFSDFVRASNNSDFAQKPTWNDAVSLIRSMPSARDEKKGETMSKTVREMTREELIAFNNELRTENELLKAELHEVEHNGHVAEENQLKYEYHYDHTDCIWYSPEARNRCPSTCAQYRDGWNDAMQYIFRDGKGYRPYRRDKKYETD